jgi:hypothetical protein
MKTRLEFLNEIYLPGHVGILSEDYQGRSGVFDFTPIEPQVTILSDKYLTPRGDHIFISQGGLCLVENILIEEGFDMSTKEYRALTFEGRLKIIELNQKYRTEVGLDKNLQGKLDLTKIRWGKMPIVKIDFDIANKAIIENLLGVLAPKPMPQTNADVLRNN